MQSVQKPYSQNVHRICPSDELIVRKYEKVLKYSVETLFVNILLKVSVES